ncbi:MAG: hypothetical protein R2865_03650 [Deinococcales bacterium]
MNSAAMRFIPKDSLVSEGYGEYLSPFLRMLTGISSGIHFKIPSTEGCDLVTALFL